MTFSKKESLNLGFTTSKFFGLSKSKFIINGTFYRSREHFNKTVSKEGMRTEFDRLEHAGIWNGYVDRMEELFSGIGQLPKMTDGTNLSAVSEGVTVTGKLQGIGFFSIDYSLNRSLKDSNFVELTNTVLVKNNATTAKSQLSTAFNFSKFFVRNLNFRLIRDFSFSQTTGSDGLDAIWGKFRGGFFELPFYYLGLFGTGGRENDLSFVNKMAGSIGNTYVKLRNNFVFSGRFDFGKTILKDLIPEYFTYTLFQDTGRSLSTFTQSRNWTFTIGKNFPIKKLGFWIFNEKSAKGKSVQDLVVKMSIGKKYDYNSKVISSTIGSSMAFAIRWSRYSTFGLGYTLTRGDSYQSIYSTDKDYVYMGIGSDTGNGSGDSFGDIEELNSGQAPSFTEVPASTKLQHQLKLNFSFPTTHKGPWNIFGLKIPIDAHWVHKNEIILQLHNTSYEKSRGGIYSFTEVFERAFLLMIKHSIDYDFSKSWNGIFYITMIFEQWKLITPSSDRLNLNEEVFSLSFGMELGLKMQIRF